jgi:hypothetical protein
MVPEAVIWKIQTKGTAFCNLYQSILCRAQLDQVPRVVRNSAVGERWTTVVHFCPVEMIFVDAGHPVDLARD